MAGMQFKRAIALAALLLSLGVSAQQPAAPPIGRSNEVLHYGVEWRLIRGGIAQLTWTPTRQQPRSEYQAQLHLESAGLVSKLYKVNNNYTVLGHDSYCATNSVLNSEESTRKRETKVSIANGKADYQERDLVKNQIISSRQIEVPGCVSDLISGLYRLRNAPPALNQSATYPITDGKKAIAMKVEAQAREDVKTPAGSFKTIRYEVFLFNDALFARKGHLYVWLTEDARRLPVQLRIKLQFYIGTINVALEKEER